MRREGRTVVWDQGVAGSNPVSPTSFSAIGPSLRSGFLAEFVFCPYCGTRIARDKVRTHYVKANATPVTEEDFQ